MNPSLWPSSPSAFDPAVHLHSESRLEPVLPPSDTNSDDLEALHAQQQECAEAKNQAGVVIQHRSWKSRDVLRSDDIFNPETPSRSRSRAGLDQQPAKMTFSSSPPLYPPSSSPPVKTKKRRLFQTLGPIELKKPKTSESFLQIHGADDRDGEQPRVQTSDAHPEIGVVPLGVNAGPAPVPIIEQPLATYDHSPDLFRGVIDPRSRSPSLPPTPELVSPKLSAKSIEMHTCSGRQLRIPFRTKSQPLSYEQIIAQRSATVAGRAKTLYYGIDIHTLVDDAAKATELEKLQLESRKPEDPLPSIEIPLSRDLRSSDAATTHQMWTEKYRAKKFTELVGDERTHRQVLRWLKGWDPVVFPGSFKSKPKRPFEDRDAIGDRQPRKILLLTGPPGLGKTTLAHVCARQAGYEILEINASDDRSRDVVKGRIKDALATENVRGIQEQGKARRAGKPVCVVVDEVDGVVTGSGGSGGEGGFMKALIDLVQLDQKNSSHAPDQQSDRKKGKKGDAFKLLRPLILICNDIYAPSLRPLRNSSVAEIVHVRKPALDKVVSRLKTVFERECIPCDNDAVRRLCESAWGLGTRKQNSMASRGAGEGDIRGVLVQGEWIAHKLRAAGQNGESTRLTRKWIESHLGESQSASGQKGLGRGGVREVIERVFLEGAGLPNLPTAMSSDEARLMAESKTAPVGVADLRKRAAINALREMIDTCGDHDRLVTDCFATYPTLIYQDDVNLSKPNAAYEWLHFHDCLSSRIFSGQEWELNPYLNTAACGFHHLFAVMDTGGKSWNEEKVAVEEQADVHPFSGLRADFAAHEAGKQNRALLTAFQSSFSGSLLRLFSSADTLATELVPSINHMVAPDVKPVVVGGSAGLASVASVRKEAEKFCIKNAVRIMEGLKVSFEKVRVEVEGGGAHASAGFAYRMDPPLDTLVHFQMGRSSGLIPAPVRYSVRQVLSQELLKAKMLHSSMARQARSTLLERSDDHLMPDDDKENAYPYPDKDQSVKASLADVKRDFFGRIINNVRPTQAEQGVAAKKAALTKMDQERVWCSYNEGFSMAVRKPITLKELLESFD